MFGSIMFIMSLFFTVWCCEKLGQYWSWVEMRQPLYEHSTLSVVFGYNERDYRFSSLLTVCRKPFVPMYVVEKMICSKLQGGEGQICENKKNHFLRSCCYLDSERVSLGEVQPVQPEEFQTFSVLFPRQQ